MVKKLIEFYISMSFKWHHNRNVSTHSRKNGGGKRVAINYDIFKCFRTFKKAVAEQLKFSYNKKYNAVMD
jgi:hypothetical protein